MPKTISELEAQRAKILKEIESKAGAINSPKKENSPSLNDWLNAAEEVMPETNKTANQSPPANNEGISYSSKILKTSHSNTASSPFFSWVILFTLFLTLAGVIYIVYSTLNKDISAVSSFKEESELQINELQENVNAIQKTLPAETNSEAYITLETQVTELKTEVQSLKATIADMQEQLALMQTSNQAQTKPTQTSVNKLVNTYQNLGKEVEQKLAGLTSKNEGNKAALNRDAASPSNNNEDSKQQNPEVSEVKSVATASTPETEMSIQTPVITQPNAKVTASIATPSLPNKPNVPSISVQKTEPTKVKVVSEDVKWLQKQQAKNYILQLASMRSESQINKMKSQNNLPTKIVAQSRNGKTNYILLTGSFETKAEAKKLATTIKKDLGISPWIRQIEDITRLIP